jgi:Peptidase family S51
VELADAYLGTLALKEMFNVLDRGGVIGGGSAGASIQGSYMVRGSSKPDDNTIMMAPGHETGFGFFTNTAIDQHVDARGRESDLGVVMKAHPELLGIGIDQSTSITVHGDVLTANGPERVAIWDGKDHGGKPYYYLRVGDTLNTVTRMARIIEHPPDPVSKEITLPKETLQQYAGLYRMQPTILMTITLDGEAELEFVKDDNGKVTQLILHQNGADVTMPRVSDAETKQIADAAASKAAWAAQRYKDQKPPPGSEDALRRVMDELRAGKPNYDQIGQS